MGACRRLRLVDMTTVIMSVEAEAWECESEVTERLCDVSDAKSSCSLFSYLHFLCNFTDDFS